MVVWRMVVVWCGLDALLRRGGEPFKFAREGEEEPLLRVDDLRLDRVVEVGHLRINSPKFAEIRRDRSGEGVREFAERVAPA